MGAWRRVLAVGFLLVFASGCSSVREELKPAELSDIQPEVKLVRQWSRSVGKGSDSRYTRLEPAVQNGVLYTVDVDGRMTAVQADSGARLWQVHLKTAIGGGVGQGGGQLYVGSLDGQVYAISPENGEVLWRARTSSEVLAAPQGNDEIVVAPSIDGRVFAFSVADGSLRWSYDHPQPVLSLRSNAAPLVTQDSVFVGFDNGQLVRFNSNNGQLRWSARISQPQGKTELERLVDVDAAPLASGPYVYGAGVNGRLSAINRGTGRVNWAEDVSTSNNIALSETGSILVSDSRSHIHSYNALTGTLEWSNDHLHRRDTSAPGVLNRAVFVVDASGYLHGLAADDGRLVARRKMSAAALGQPLAVGDTLIVYDRKGTLTAFALEWLNVPAPAAEAAAEMGESTP